MGDYPKAIEENNRILAIDPANESAKSTIHISRLLQKNAIPKAHPNEITGVISDAAGSLFRVHQSGLRIRLPKHGPMPR